MQANEADLAYLWDMLKAAEAICRFVAGLDRETYFASEVLQAAVERKLEIIGETAHKVSPAFQKEHPKLPWSKTIGQRNILAHNYGVVDHQRIGQVVTVHIRIDLRKFRRHQNCRFLPTCLSLGCAKMNKFVGQLAQILQPWFEE